MHRTPPQSTTGVSPAEILFQRKLQTCTPGIDEFQLHDQEVRDRDSKEESCIPTRKGEPMKAMRLKGKKYCLNKNEQIS